MIIDDFYKKEELVQLGFKRIGENVKIANSLIVEGCIVDGEVEDSILSQGVIVGKNTIIKNSVIMPNVIIGDNVVIERAIIGNGSTISNDCHIGNGDNIQVVGAYQCVIK